VKLEVCERIAQLLLEYQKGVVDLSKFFTWVFVVSALVCALLFVRAGSTRQSSFSLPLTVSLSLSKSSGVRINDPIEAVVSVRNGSSEAEDFFFINAPFHVIASDAHERELLVATNDLFAGEGTNGLSISPKFLLMPPARGAEIVITMAAGKSYSSPPFTVTFTRPGVYLVKGLFRTRLALGGKYELEIMATGGDKLISVKE
jgi:hypothetical protein